MVPRQQVIDYVSSNLRSGYDLPSIRSRLISAGYEAGEVNSAIDLVKSGKTAAPVSHAGTYTLVAFVLIGFLLIAGVTTVFFKQNTISPVSSGTDTSFQTPTQTTTPKTQSSGSSGQTTTQTTSPTSASTSSGSGTSLSGPTTSATDSGRTIPPIDYGSSGLDPQLTTRLALDQKADQLAANQPDDAIAACNQINTAAGQQACIARVARISGQSKYCTQLSDSDSADSCLINLATDHAEDVNLCKQIKSDIRFRQCVVAYDAQDQLDTIQRAAANVSATPLAAPTQADQTPSDASNVNIDEIPVTNDSQGATSAQAGAGDQNVSDTTAADNATTIDTNSTDAGTQTQAVN